MSDDLLTARLRAANPVPGTPAAGAPASVLEHIVATPQGGSPRRRHSGALVRRPLLALCVVLLLACGIALAAGFSVRYFGDAGGKPLPAPVRKALTLAATTYGPADTLTLGDTVVAYVFTSDAGRGTVYMAPYDHRPGFCAALAIVGKPVQAGCDSTAGTIATTTGQGVQPWGLALTPDMHTLLGRLAPTAAGDTVEIAFEDGTTDDAPMHGRWFAYAVAGKRTQAGHRPTQLRVRDGKRVIRRISVDPIGFNTLAAARALVPASDGSAGQDAIRRMLLAQLTLNSSDGGALASHTDLAATKLVTSLAFGHGRVLSVYGAPIAPVAGWNARGSILVEIDNRSARPAGGRFGVNGLRGARFSSLAGCSCSLSLHDKGTFWFLYGEVPQRVARVTFRMRDGRELPAGLYDGGREWAWLGHDDDVPANRPVALVGRDAAGAVVTIHRLAVGAGHSLR
jgi:hypothetical protein